MTKTISTKAKSKKGLKKGLQWKIIISKSLTRWPLIKASPFKCSGDS